MFFFIQIVLPVLGPLYLPLHGKAILLVSTKEGKNPAEVSRRIASILEIDAAGLPS